MATRAEKLLSKGQALERKGKRDKALELYRDACDKEPYDPELWTARAAVAHALGNAPEATSSLFRAADIYARAAMPSEALTLARRVLEIDKNHGGARRFLSMLQARYGVGEDEPQRHPPAEKRQVEESIPVAPAPEAAAPTHALAVGSTPPEDAAAVPSARVAPEPAPEPAVETAAPTPEAPPPSPELPPQAATLSPPLAFSIDEISLAERLPTAPAGQETQQETEFPLDDEPVIDIVKAIASTVSSSPLLSELDTDLVRVLIDCGRLVHRSTGHVVFTQGELGTSLFLVLRGEVSVVREGLASGEQELARLRPGAFFGEMAVLTNAPRSATVRARKDTTLLEISRQDVRSLIDSDGRVLKLLMRFFRARLVGTLLQTSSMFQLFTREQRRDLVRKFRLREIPEARAVVQEGSPSEGLFMVLSGQLEVVRLQEGQEALLGSLCTGDVFGEMSLLQSTPAMATVRARGRSWILVLPREDFFRLIEEHPDVRAYLAELASERQSRNQATLLSEAGRWVEKRLEPV
ncbi:MAG: cyclic nucleotide-binding domain-containing protein [Deltaproteobacteria bacterium]|nr:cyclic nucleotide-binding domain-containing protein [Deltaproteobacteria bacterium]